MQQAGDSCGLLLTLQGRQLPSSCLEPLTRFVPSSLVTLWMPLVTPPQPLTH